jgi:hypothetical protein
MRREKSYKDKYGPDAGTKMFKALQKEAAQARWKAHYRKKAKEP